jgi:CRISPR system Cascade subunit CasE
VLNLRNRNTQRDLADCMAMHRMLMSAFPDNLSADATARAEAGLLYRVEETGGGAIAVLAQSALPPDWGQLPASWLHPDAGPQVKEIGGLLSRIEPGSQLRFKLVANPTRKIDTKTGADGSKRNGKRVELRGEQAWLAWLDRKAGQSGFRLKAVSAASHVHDVRSHRDLTATGRKERPDGSSSRLTFCGVAFEGRLEVVDAALLGASIRAGIGPGKAYGYGLLSVAPGG